MITTPRLIIRPLTPADITSGYIDALNDPEVVQYTEARHRTWTRDSVEAYVTANLESDDAFLFGLFLADGTHIGNIHLFNLHKVHNRGELGILLFKPFWGNGYGTEALRAVTDYAINTLNLQAVRADYYSCNEGSAAIFKKAGYQIEGRFIGHFKLERGYTDSVRVAFYAGVNGEPPI